LRESPHGFHAPALFQLRQGPASVLEWSKVVLLVGMCLAMRTAIDGEECSKDKAFGNFPKRAWRQWFSIQDIRDDRVGALYRAGGMSVDNLIFEAAFRHHMRGHMLFY
jgi:hypothetical protein